MLTVKNYTIQPENLEMPDSNTTPPGENSTHEPAPVKSNGLKNSLIAAGVIAMLLVTASLFIGDKPATPPATTSQETAALTAEPAPVSTVKTTTSSEPTISVTLPDPTQPPSINLSGTWYDDSGTKFEAIQKGNKFISTGFNAFGMASKQMYGTISGDTLYFTLKDGFVETDGAGTLNEDGEHFDYTLVQGTFRESGQLHLNHKRN